MSSSNNIREVPRLETKRLVLRDVLAFTHLEEAQQFLEQMRSRCERGEEMHWGIALKGEDYIVGICGYSWHLGRQFGAIGYDLARLYWKQGIMTEAIQTLLRFGFEVRNLHRVEARVRLGNDASMRLLQKLGFQEEGILRESLFLNNHFFDIKIFSLLKSEYQITR